MSIKLLSPAIQLRRWLPILLVLTLVALILAQGWPGTFVPADCLWARSAKAWVDQNRDGRWDSPEPPLARVQFFVDDVRNELTNVAQKALSNERGEAVLRVLLPNCNTTRFDIYVQSPELYESTTNVRVPGRGNGPFLFGFAPSNGTAGN